jgi:hypothetical protein
MVPLKAVGLVSGTASGRDAALLETDGITLSHTGPIMSPPERDLRQALADASALLDPKARPAVLAEAD